MVPWRVDQVQEEENPKASLQRARGGTHTREEACEFQVWHVKGKADESEPSASVNMVFILPMEFKAPSDDEEEERRMDPVQDAFDKLEDKSAGT
jgi:hypothetical protein